MPSAPDNSLPDSLSLPLTAPKDGMPVTAQEFLAGVQLASSISDILIPFPASMRDGEESIPANTRVPAHWIAQIEEMRDKVGSTVAYRQVWKTRGDFYRWCIAMGMRMARQIERLLNEEGEMITLDPIIETQNFVERTSGDLVARTQTMTSIRAQAATISEGIQDLVLRGEPEEAANMILTYSEGVTKLSSPFWKRYTLEALITKPEVAKILVQLIDDDHITDEALIGMYDYLVNKATPPDADDGVDT